MMRSIGTRSRGSSDAGFSLLEMIVSIGLMALILSAMPAAIRLATRALNAVQGVDRNFANHTALDFVEQRLGEALSIYDRGADGRLQIVFRGEVDSLTFVAPAAIGPEGGLYRFELRALQEPDADITALASSSSSNGLGLHLSWNEFRPSRRDIALIDRRDKRIVSGLAEFSLRYYGPPSLRSAPEWQDAWTSQDRLPDLVEIRTAVTNAGQTTARIIRVPLHLKPPR